MNVAVSWSKTSVSTLDVASTLAGSASRIRAVDGQSSSRTATWCSWMAVILVPTSRDIDNSFEVIIARIGQIAVCDWAAEEVTFGATLGRFLGARAKAAS